eukprot:49473-Rhodomonas_salina.5
MGDYSWETVTSDRSTASKLTVIGKRSNCTRTSSSTLLPHRSTRRSCTLAWLQHTSVSALNRREAALH